MLKILSRKRWTHFKPQYLLNSSISSHHFDFSSSGCSSKPSNSLFLLPQNRFLSSGYSSNHRNFDKSWRIGGGVLMNSGLVGSKRSFCSGSDRDSMEYDVVIVGAGPAGLSAAIRLKQLCVEKGVDFSVCVVEKGAEVGAHILSGNVFEPRALDELIPDWKQEQAPIDTPVTSDKFWFLTRDRALSLPSPFDNKGNYVIRWKGQSDSFHSKHSEEEEIRIKSPTENERKKKKKDRTESYGKRKKKEEGRRRKKKEERRRRKKNSRSEMVGDEEKKTKEEGRRRKKKKKKKKSVPDQWRLSPARCLLSRPPRSFN